MHAEGKPIAPGSIARRLSAAPGVERLRAALAGERAYLVGGAVRDLLLGAEHPDLDVAVEGDAPELARRLGAEPVAHERFATATIDLEGVRVDLASARAERYERPGALPLVEPADIRRDLARRDFSVNAMAVPLSGEPELIDPHAGLDDLRAGLLRVLHPGSFVDDPTRALRAARYAARLGFELEAQTAALLAEADLGTVSRDRVEAELRRIADEMTAPRAFSLLGAWGLAGVDSGAGPRADAARAIVGRPEWAGAADPAGAVLAAALPDPELEATALRLASARPASASEAAALARGRSPIELVAARIASAEWLDDYMRDWRHVELEIDGSDLIAAGIPEGPGIGRGLSAALDAKLDGEIGGREDELRVALEAAS